MAYLDINEKIMITLNNDNIESALHKIIDDELNKDVSKMNTRLIDECVNALLKIEQDKDNQFAVVVPLMSSDAFLHKMNPPRINWKSMNIFARAALIAALLASTTLTVNAAYRNMTGIDMFNEIGNAIQSKLLDWGILTDNQANETDSTDSNIVPIHEEKEETTKPEETTDVSAKMTRIVYTPQIEQMEGNDEEEEETATRPQIEQLNGDDEEDEEPITELTTRKKPEPTTEKPVAPSKPTQEDEKVLRAFSADFDDNFKVDYIYGETLSYDGITLTAHYSDGSSRKVALEECNYTKSVNMNTTGNHTLRIIYETCVIQIDITVRPDEDTRGAAICENDLYDYMLTKNGAYITQYKGDEADITLHTIDGNTVYAIGADVFAGKNITHFESDSCQKIFDRAFRDCAALEDCITPRATYIGANAFENDLKFKTPVFNDYLSYLGTAAYKNSGITELKLKSTIAAIPDNLCENCADLTIVDLQGAAQVGNNAFSGCSSLETVDGTDGLTTAGDFAFYNCTNAAFTEKPTRLSVAGSNAFAYCNSIDFGKLTLTQVGPYSFAYCHKLAEVDLDGSIAIVPEGAFRGAHLQTLTLHEGTREIDDTAFMSTSLVRVDLPSSVTRIGTYGLYSTKLREVYCTRNLTTIENVAFFRSRLTMYVYANSYAHTYAYENNIKYEIIGNYNGVIQIEGEDEDDEPTDDTINQINGQDD